MSEKIDIVIVKDKHYVTTIFSEDAKDWDRVVFASANLWNNYFAGEKEPQERLLILKGDN